MTNKFQKAKSLLFIIFLVMALICVLTACNKTSTQDMDNNDFSSITLNHNDGTDTTEVVEINESILDKKLTRQGYTFVGWALDANGTILVDENTAITNGMVFYAVWQAKVFTVNFWLDDETLIKTETVKYLESATAPTEEEINEKLKSNERFTSWDRDAYTAVTRNLNIYAIISHLDSSAKFYSDGVLISTIDGKKGEVIPSPENPIKAGFVFNGFINRDTKEKFSYGTNLFNGNESYDATYTLITPTIPNIKGAQKLTYGDQISLTSLAGTNYDGITYTYNWSIDGVTVSNEKELVLEKIKTGTYNYLFTITAHATGCEDKSNSIIKTVTVNKAELEVTPSLITVTYGDEIVKDYTLSFSGFKYEETEDVVYGTAKFSTLYSPLDAVGNYSYSISNLEADNYSFKYNFGTVSVLKKDITVNDFLCESYSGMPITKAKEYNDIEGLALNQTILATYKTSAADVDTYKSIENSLITSSLSIKDANNKDVTINYNILVDVSLSIVPIDMSLSSLPENKTITFDNEFHTFGLNVPSDYSVKYYVNNEEVESPSIKDANVYNIKAIVSNKNYNDLEYTYVITVNKADIQFVAKEQDATYGTEFNLDQKAFTIVGNTYGYTFNVVLSTDYEVSNNVGKYDILVSATIEDNNNFNIISTVGTLTINKKDIYVTINKFNTSFGDPFDISSVTYSIDGLVGEDDAKITLSTSYTQGNNVGEYAVTGTSSNENYNVTFKDSIIEVVKKIVKVKVNNDTVSYGANYTNYGYEILEGSLYNASDLVLSYTTDYEIGQDAKTFANLFGSAQDNSNYEFEVEKGKLEVEKATLTIKLNDEEVIYGNNFTSKKGYEIINGSLYQNDTFNLVCSTEYTINSFDTFSISGTATNDNYTITVLDGTLYVLPRPITITIIDSNTTYGETFDLTSLSYILEDGSTIINSDDLGISYSTNYAIGNNVGLYDLKATASNNKYDVTINNGNLTVSQRPISIKVVDASITYGEAIDLSSIGYSILSGSLYNDDTFAFTCTTNYVQGDRAGVLCKLIGNVENNPNYSVTIQNGSLSVLKRDITLTINNNSITYGDALDLSTQSYEVSVGSLYNKDNIVLNYTSEYVAGEINSCSILGTASSGADDYELTIIPGTLSINKRNASISESLVIKAYDSQLYVRNYANATFSNAFNLDTITGTIKSRDSEPGDYVANGSLEDYFVWDNGYKITNANNINVTSMYNLEYYFTVTISVDLISFTPNNVNITYDGMSHSGSVDVSDIGCDITYSINNETFSNENPSFVDAGTYTVYFKLTKEGKTPTAGSYSVVINKKVATITFDNDEVHYKDAVPTYTYSVNGVLNADEALVNVTSSCAYNATSEVGTYAISGSVANLDNYSFVVTPGTLTVVAKEITVQEQNASIYYGDDAPTFTFSVSDEDAKDYIEIKTAYVIGNDVGSYSIYATNSSKNYSISDTTATLTVEKRTVTIKAADISTSYGVAPVYSFIASNLYSTDTISGVIYSCSGISVGTYDITPYIEDTTNYTFKFNNGTLTITKAKLVGELNGENVITYGADLPTYTATYTGFKYSDDASVILGTLTTSSTYTLNKATGTFSVNASGVTATNYDIEFDEFNITVNKANITLTVNDINDITYGDNIPSFTFSAEGLQNGDTVSMLTGVKYETKYSKGADVGTYTYNISSNSTLANYNILIGEDKSFRVNKATLTLSATNHSAITYGDDVPTDFGFTCNGLLVGDTSSIVKNIEYTTTYTKGSNAGTYSYNVDLENVSLTNYDVVKGVDNTLTVNKAKLTLITSAHNAITYGDELPTDFSYTYTGLLFEDTIMPIEVSYSSTYTKGSNAGNYTFNVVVGNYTSTNYEVVASSVSQTLKVNKAVLTVSVLAHSAISYGDDIPTDFAYTISGLVNGDSFTTISGLKVTTTYTKGSIVGSNYTFNIDPTSATLTNYTLVAGPNQTLVVNKANYVGVQHDILRGTYVYNATLAAFTLNNGYTWVDATIKPTCDVTSYEAIYNGDPTNYNDYNLNVTLYLEKATPTITASEATLDYTGNAFTVMDAVNASCDNTDGGFTLTPSITTVSYGGIYNVKITVSETTNYKSTSKSVNIYVRSAVIDSTYYTLEDALNKGGEITLKGNTYLSAGTYTLNSSSTLLMPYDGTNINTDGTNSNNGYIDISNEATYKKMELIFKPGVSLTVAGTLKVGGITGHAGQAFSGQTSADYTQITIPETSSMIVTGTLYVYGYIKGNGTVTANSSANIYEPFVVRDFRGGTSTYGAYDKGEISPFNQYEMPNIQPTLTINYGASLYGLCDFYINSEHQKTTAKIIGTSDSFLVLSNGAYIVGKYTGSYDGSQSNYANKYPSKTKLDFYGDVEVSSLAVSVTVLLVTVDIDTATVFCPIPHMFDIGLHSGTVTISTPFKLLPGAKLTIDSGATLKMSSKKVSTGWFSSTTYYGQLSVYDSSWVDTCSLVAGCQYPSDKGDGILIVNGTIDCSQEGSSVAGNIRSTKSGKIIFGSNATLSLTTSEGYGTSSNKITYSYTELNSITQTSKLYNADGTTITASTGKTYNYNSSTGVWE